METFGSLGDEMVSTLAQNARDVGLITALGAIFSIFVTPHATGCYGHDPIQAACCMAVEPTMTMYI